MAGDPNRASRWANAFAPGLIMVGADGIMNGLWALRGRTGSERLTPAA
jgi:hypothetical protein